MTTYSSYSLFTQHSSTDGTTLEGNVKNPGSPSPARRARSTGANEAEREREKGGSVTPAVGGQSRRKDAHRKKVEAEMTNTAERRCRSQRERRGRTFYPDGCIHIHVE